MTMGSHPYLAHCEVSPLVICYAQWDSMLVDQVILVTVGGQKRQNEDNRNPIKKIKGVNLQ